MTPSLLDTKVSKTTFTLYCIYFMLPLFIHHLSKIADWQSKARFYFFFNQRTLDFIILLFFFTCPGHPLITAFADRFTLVKYVIIIIIIII